MLEFKVKFFVLLVAVVDVVLSVTSTPNNVAGAEKKLISDFSNFMEFLNLANSFAEKKDLKVCPIWTAERILKIYDETQNWDPYELAQLRMEDPKADLLYRLLVIFKGADNLEEKEVEKAQVCSNLFYQYKISLFLLNEGKLEIRRPKNTDAEELFNAILNEEKITVSMLQRFSHEYQLQQISYQSGYVGRFQPFESFDYLSWDITHALATTVLPLARTVKDDLELVGLKPMLLKRLNEMGYKLGENTRAPLEI